MPQKSFITIYKAFLRPLIDYGDIVYNQPQNDSFSEKLEAIQYKTALVITGAIQRTSRDKIYQEVGLESLKSRRWYKCLSLMFKIMKEQTIRTRNNCILVYHCRIQAFFFPSTFKDWFSLDEGIRNSETRQFRLIITIYSSSSEQYIQYL